MPDADPPVAAVITVNDMYHEMQGLRSDVQALAGKVDVIPLQLAQVTAMVQTHDQTLRARDVMPGKIADLEKDRDDHEVAIRELRKDTTVTKTQLKVIVAVLVFVVAALGTVAGIFQAVHG